MRKFVGCMLLVAVLMSLTGCGPDSNQRKIKNPKPSPGLVEWHDRHKEARTVLWREADVNGDSRKDTVLIYKDTDDKCYLTVIITDEGRFETLEPVPAPLENQQIQFKNIDKKVPMEFIVSGSRGTNTGYAIFRIEDGKIVDLFGQDMDKCC